MDQKGKDPDSFQYRAVEYLVRVSAVLLCGWLLHRPVCKMLGSHYLLLSILLLDTTSSLLRNVTLAHSSEERL